MSNDSGEVQTSNQGSVEEVCQYVLEISVSTFYSCTDELGKLAENKAQYDAYMRGACRKLVGRQHFFGQFAKPQVLDLYYYVV